MRRVAALTVLLPLLPAGTTAGAAAPLFVEATAASGIPALRFGEGVNAVDLDGDGLPELFLPSVRGPDRLYRNLGGLRFAEVTGPWGLGGEGGIGAVVADFDGDGSGEIAVVRGAWPSGGVTLLDRGADGRFSDVSAAAGLTTRRNGIAAAVADVDGDGRPDLFVSAWGGDLLLRNEGGTPPRFAEMPGPGGPGAAGRSWGALLADFNADGVADLFVARGAPGSAERSRLFIGEGRGSFRDATAATDSMNSSHSVGVAAGCVDGDALPDLVVAGYEGPVRLYRNLGGGRFAEQTADAGLQAHRRNEGVVLADLDRDGDLDLYVTNLDGENRLYRNTLGGAGFLRIVPRGAAPGVHGATAWLVRAGEAGPGAAQPILSGTGFCSQGPPEFLFRLPDAGPWEPRVRYTGGETARLPAVSGGSIDAP